MNEEGKVQSELNSCFEIKLINTLMNENRKDLEGKPAQLMNNSTKIKIFREEIKSKINQKDFWHLCKMDLSKEEIIDVLEEVGQTSKLKGIDFYMNSVFDDVCAQRYIEALRINQSIIGIDLFTLNITLDIQKKFFTLFKEKANILYLVVDSKLFNNEEAEKMAIEANLMLDDDDSFALQVYRDYSFYYEDVPYWASQILFFSRKPMN